MKPWNFRAAVKDVVARAGFLRLRFTIFTTHASLLAESGVSLEVISERFAHRGIAASWVRLAPKGEHRRRKFVRALLGKKCPHPSPIAPQNTSGLLIDRASVMPSVTTTKALPASNGRDCEPKRASYPRPMIGAVGPRCACCPFPSKSSAVS